MWSARVEPDRGLHFQLHLESADYYAEREIDDDDHENETESDFEAPGTWGNFHSCTLSSTQWDEGVWTAGDDAPPLRFAEISARMFHIDDPEPPDFDAGDFDARALSTRLFSTRRATVEWLTPSVAPAARTDPVRARARKCRTSSQSTAATVAPRGTRARRGRSWLSGSSTSSVSRETPRHHGPHDGADDGAVQRAGQVVGRVIEGVQRSGNLRDDRASAETTNAANAASEK